MMQVPASMVPVQLCEPSLTVQLPVGVPAPGSMTLAEYPIATGWPTTERDGVRLTIATDVSALLTWCDVAADAEALQFVSSTYEAVRLFRPTEPNVNEQPPPATVPVQL